jgi:hypothetical protein
MNKLNIYSFAKMQGIVMTLVGLLAGIIYSFGGLLIDTLVTFNLMTTTETPGLSYGTILAFGALVGMPVIFGMFGFATGFIGAYMYNVVVTCFKV